MILSSFSALADEPTFTLTPSNDGMILEINHRYVSRWKRSDVDAIINPQSGHIQDLFKDPIDLQGVSKLRYKVDTSISVMFVKMSFAALLDYAQTVSATKTTHVFRFTNFDKLFKNSTINVDVFDKDSVSVIGIKQVAVIKSDSYEKIKGIPTGEKTFRSRILANIKKFQLSTTGK
jgi:hypothetical protein